MTLQGYIQGLLGLVLFGILFPTAAAAQVDTSRTALPNIAPNEVEIRGKLEISLPSLRRQPLVGFNPPPQVPRPPAGRHPFVETYKQSSSDLPASPLQRPQPPSALGAAHPPAQGQLESTAGRYFSRTVNARLQAPITDHTSFLLRADYRGSEGYQPFDEIPDLNAPFDAVDGLIGIQTAQSRWAAGVTFEGFFEAYDLYGLQPADLAQPVDPTLLPNIDREGAGGTGTLHLATLGEVPVEARLDLSYGATRYETFNALGGSLALSERRLEAAAEARFPVAFGDIWIDGGLSTATLADDLGTYAAAEGAGGVRIEVNPSLTLTVGARFLNAFSDTDQSPDFPTEETRRQYVSPDLRIEFVPRRGIRLYAQNRPTVAPNAIAEVYRINPYLDAQPPLRPTMRSVDAEAGVNLFTGPIQVAIRGGFQDMPQYLFFENDTEDSRLGQMTVQYGEVEVAHVGGSVSVVLPGGLHAMVGASYRDGRLLDPAGDLDIPYFAPVVGEATLSYSFAQSRGLLQLKSYLESARYIDRAQTRKVDTYLDFDVEGSYRVTHALGVVAYIDNISGNNNARWENYPQSPVVFGAGLRVGW